MDKFLEELNPAQREAVLNTEGPSLIIAGAGSGKTRVLTFRIAHLLSKGVQPYSILALTFTNKAAREMKNRICAIVDPTLTKKLWMGTFHSIFAKILRIEAAATDFNSNFTIYDTTDTLSIIRGIVKDLKLDDKTYRDRAVYGRISMAKNYLITPRAYASNSQLTDEDRRIRRPYISEIYKRYDTKCRNANAMDFDDLLLNTNILFRDRPDILAKYQRIFRYVLVDEYQDTNLAQYLIVKKLAESHGNISVVGDDAQSIYSFRGARIENILNFRNDYPNYSEFKLEQNYRSTRTIVDAANSLIAKNSRQLKKKCFSKGDVGEKIEVIKAFTDQEEGLSVASSVLETVYSNRANFSDFAVLYRTNAQSRIFEDAFRKRSIPYRIYGGISFYQRAEIKDALAYMRLAANPADDEAFRRIVNYPARGIGDVTLEKIQAAAERENTSLWNIITSLPLDSVGIKTGAASKLSDFVRLIMSFTKRVDTGNVYEFASDIVKKSGMMADLKNNKTPEGISRLENIEEMLNGIAEYVNNAPEDEIPTVAQYLQNIALITDADKEDPEDKKKVSLMTVHSAKGLEFDYVYIVGMEEGLFPGSNSVQSEHELEEERRLFYVAITRAAKRAMISYAQTRYKWGSLASSAPSRFLRDIDAIYYNPGAIEPETGKIKHTVRKETTAPKSLQSKQTLTSAQSNRNSNQSPETLSDTSLISPGTEVEHARFGKGKVLELEGTGNEAKAQIEFYEVGKKTLLLKFAKLSVVQI